MQFLTPDDGQVWPQASPSGESGRLLDTGWDVNWPGPGHIYLGVRDCADIVVATHKEALVSEALEANGWIAPGKTSARVEELEQQLADVGADLDEALAVQAGFEAAVKKLKAATLKSRAVKKEAKS